MTASPRLKVLDSITDVSAAQWDGVLPADPVPFLRHAWIAAMEESGSATPETGWQPAHLTLWRGPRLVAAAPAYRKFHSMGEYIYDFGWAGAAERAGIAYYPKLLVGVPLSPATAPRLLVAPGEDVPALRRALVTAMVELARESGCSGVHVLYPPEEEAAFLEEAGMLRRLTLQFHWENPGYGSYADYLARFDSKRRNQLKRERAAAAAQGITLRTLAGAELTEAHADLAGRFYEATCEKKSWGSIQLTPDFFRRVFTTLTPQVELVVAEREGRVVAGAFNLATRERLFGRYWGCFEEHPFLHFHVCLYHSVDDCIRRGLRVFEPGAGGEHKISRGFAPRGIHSAHLLFHPKLAGAVAGACRREAEHHRRVIEQAGELTGMKPWAGGPVRPAANG